MRKFIFLILAIPALIAALIIDMNHLVALNFKGKEVVGTILKKDCKNHGKITYSYAVDSRIYTDFSMMCKSVHCDSANVSDPIVLTVLPSRPEISTCSDPFKDLLNVGVIFIVITGVSIFWTKRALSQYDLKMRIGQ